MAVNQQQLIDSLREQVERVPERCNGYRHELLEALGDVLSYERAHRQRKTNIQQDVKGKCEAVGDFLIRSGWGE